ncbi:hypothetical protein DP939_29640 [Spongiactinospora rosea]|uniref:4-amino-4-deoxy-L-arabinose transferase-like glycosyltransferase n=1 Tax=Spongiactinospora rosea TaxID=2248750 RepID=A0A366LRV9_9ACTN|nr:hypothetical protein [Spongiactinospora rosea]RBQ16487.1 hypothetical protein DP939_29640 [Spongiactinospora rosea]
MTVATTAIEQAGRRSTAERPPRGIPGVRLLPGAAVLAAAVVTLLAHDTPGPDIARYFGYLVLGIVVPGTLIWRACGPRRCALPVELAAGAAVGYALEIGAYAAARAAGAPRAFLAWPVITIVLFAVVPALRRHYHLRPQAERVPVGAAWTLAGLVMALVVFAAPAFYRAHGLAWPGNAAPYVDMPFHLSLVGELRHHMPPTVPEVAGEPLAYHWFLYADLAATSWATGIEAQTVLYRLAILPMAAAFTILVAALGRRIAGSWWAGAAAVALSYLAGTPDLFGWRDSPLPSGALAGTLTWLSPTQTFGAALFAALTLAIAGVLRRATPARLALVLVLLTAVSGAKATFVPLIGAGLALLLLFRRDRVVLALLAMTAAVLAFAQFVVFGGASQGMSVRPGALAAWLVSTHPAPGDDPARLTVAVSVALGAGWAVAFAGVALLRRAHWKNPMVPVCLGIGLASAGAALMFGHPGVSQLYFLRGGWPYLAVLAAAGLRVALARVPALARPALIAVCLTGGAALAMETRSAAGDVLNMDTALVPVAILAGAAALTALVVLRSTGGVAAVLLLLAGLCAGPQVTGQLNAYSGGPHAIPEVPEVPRGGMEAARWLRANTGHGEIIATNVHCRGVRVRHCDNRHFWASAYSERRMLVEGWGYTPTNLGQVVDYQADRYTTFIFWDQARLAANDAVFREPSREAVRRLLTGHGVRWLLVDQRDPLLSDDVGRYTALRFRSGDCAVYQITPWAANPDIFSPFV